MHTKKLYWIFNDRIDYVVTQRLKSKSWISFPIKWHHILNDNIKTKKIFQRNNLGRTSILKSYLVMILKMALKRHIQKQDNWQEKKIIMNKRKKKVAKNNIYLFCQNLVCIYLICTKLTYFNVYFKLMIEFFIRDKKILRLWCVLYSSQY